MASKRKRFLDDAALQSLVRFGPQLQVLEQAQRTATDQYKSGIAQADAGRVGVQQAVDAVVPQLAGVYDQAGLDAARTSQTLIGKDLAGLSGVADSIKGGAALEAAGMAGRLGAAKTQALTDLGDRRVQAATGAVTAKRQVRSELTENLAKIFEQAKALTGQQGAFEASAFSDLVNKDSDRIHDTNIANAGNAQSERNSLRSAGIDPNTGWAIPGGKLDPAAKAKKPTYASTDKHIEFASNIAEIARYASKYKGKFKRSQIVDQLAKGRPQESFYADEDGNRVPDTDKNKKGVYKVTRPAVPRFEPDIRMTAALDVALDGHLSRETQLELQRQHFKIKDLGLPSYGEWRKRNPRASRAERQAFQEEQRAARRAVGSLPGG